tara:strand:+ start:270 stop:755 length:486 start_codon:yes stop_codon:yes gene_type:complete
MEVHLIWAQDKNGGIGKNGKLPWHISEDLKNFKRITLNSTIIMGRKTWESLPIKPLPNRDNIILSKTLVLDILTFKTYENCIDNLIKRNISKVFIIGGRSMYKLFFNKADYLHITNIDLLEEGINEFFPISSNDIISRFQKIDSIKLNKVAEYTLWSKNNY